VTASLSAPYSHATHIHQGTPCKLTSPSPGGGGMEKIWSTFAVPGPSGQDRPGIYKHEKKPHEQPPNDRTSSKMARLVTQQNEYQQAMVLGKRLSQALHAPCDPSRPEVSVYPWVNCCVVEVWPHVGGVGMCYMHALYLITDLRRWKSESELSSAPTSTCLGMNCNIGGTT